MAFPIRGNSYTEPFYAAIEALGAQVHEGIFAGRWLLKNLRGVDYVHMHWPSFFYNFPRPASCIRGFGLFLFLLALARWRGARIIWTVHNIYPHDPCVVPRLHQIVRWVLVRTASWFLVHGPSAEREVLRCFPGTKGRIIQIDHGHWVDYYPNRVSRDAARQKLGIAEGAYAFVFVGLCKPYKNLEALVAAFDRVRSDAVLLIAGRFDDPEYEARIRSAIERAASRSRIQIHGKFIPDEDLQIFLNAADAVVTPYVETLTSGTAMLALSFGRPVIAPARGSLKDLVTADCGVLYSPQQPNGLEEAMLRAMDSAFDPEQITAHALSYNWDRSAARLLDVLGSR